MVQLVIPAAFEFTELERCDAFIGFFFFVLSIYTCKTVFINIFRNLIFVQ